MLEVSLKAKGSTTPFCCLCKLHKRQFHICSLKGKFEVEK